MKRNFILSAKIFYIALAMTSVSTSASVVPQVNDEFNNGSLASWSSIDNGNIGTSVIEEKAGLLMMTSSGGDSAWTNKGVRKTIPATSNFALSFVIKVDVTANDVGNKSAVFRIFDTDDKNYSIFIGKDFQYERDPQICRQSGCTGPNYTSDGVNNKRFTYSVIKLGSNISIYKDGVLLLTEVASIGAVDRVDFYTTVKENAGEFGVEIDDFHMIMGD